MALGIASDEENLDEMINGVMSCHSCFCFGFSIV